MGSDQFAFEEVKRFMGRLGSALLIAVVLFLIAGQPSTVQSQPVLTQDGTALSVERTGGTVRVVYFYAEDCPH